MKYQYGRDRVDGRDVIALTRIEMGQELGRILIKSQTPDGMLPCHARPIARSETNAIAVWR